MASSTAQNEAPDKHFADLDEVKGLIFDGIEWVREDSRGKEVTVAGIANGGLINTFYLAKAMGVKLYSIPVTSYEDLPEGGGTQTKQPEVDEDDIPLNLANAKNLYIAEDLVDTGDTMRAVKKFFPEAKTIALYSKLSPEATDVLLDFCGRILEHGKDEKAPWITFYYDQEVQDRFHGAKS